MLPKGRRRVIYEHNWRPDFVGEALTIELEKESEVVSLEFYSSEYGIVKWVRKQGLLPSHSWECDRNPLGTLHGQHYPVALLNGAEPFSNTQKIVQDVLSHPCLEHLRTTLCAKSLQDKGSIIVSGKTL
jgi:hypothetical protein